MGEGNRKLLKVGELARLTGLTRQSLHQYVLLGLLTPIETTKGGQRLFDRGAIRRVKLIQDCCANGYSLGEMRDTFFKGKR
ncbi:MAG TPA: MerR family transcriptional regulator [Planctomycetota bacterium]|jgi:DNA-binding transcriptional MerR regulator